ncbi:MAG TPA: helix-turn-helix transcriptional regulator [Candidatus Butyricicoccus stercorigallinarum]|nr:helix-turn-helix transcriptional regulator [Candidatus Butyricicoccus stercorigallinarum]
MNFASNLQQLRRQRGLSQQQLADRLNVSRQAVSKWERGEAQPDLDHVLQISRLFDITVDQLLTGAPPAFPQPVQTGGGWRRRAGAALLAAGGVLGVLACLAALWLKQLDMQTGEWFTHAADYLRQFPASVFAVGAALCLAGGIALLALPRRKKDPRTPPSDASPR